MIQELFLPCLHAFVASIAFAILFNIHGTGVVICGFGGAVGWLVYLLAAPFFHSSIIQSFFAALAISAFAEIMSRIRKCPVTGYLLVAFFPLVPGGGIYYTMKYCMDGQTDLFFSKGLETLGIAGALALGVLLVSSSVRLITNLHYHKKGAQP